MLVKWLVVVAKLLDFRFAKLEHKDWTRFESMINFKSLALVVELEGHNSKLE